MTLHWISFASILVLTLCQANPIIDEEFPDVVDLTSIRYIDKNQYEIYIKDGEYKGESPKSYHATILIENKEHEEHTDIGSNPVKVKTGYKITFDGDIKPYSGLEDVDLDFVGAKDDEGLKPLLKAEPAWGRFPVFPKEFIVQYDESQKILRYFQDQGSMTTMVTDMDENDKAITSVDDKTLGYYLDVKTRDTMQKDFMPCSNKLGIPEKDEELAVCDASIHPEDVKLKKMKVEEACLHYSYGEDSGVAFTVGMTDVGINTNDLEFIVDFELETADDTVHRAKVTDTETREKMAVFPMPDYSYLTNPSVDMTIVGIEENRMKSFAQLNFIDYKVVGYPISKTSLEVHWDHNKGWDQFHLTGMKVDDEKFDFPETFVHCTNPADRHCFGYFRNLDEEADYKVKVKPDNKPENRIESKQISLKVKHDLNIEYTRLREINGDLVASLCFNHTDNTVEKLSKHYDIVVIDHRGQWQKERLIVNNVALGNTLCGGVWGKKNNVVDVDKATVLVIQRAQDGVTPLASGEIQIQ